MDAYCHSLSEYGSRPQNQVRLNGAFLTAEVLVKRFVAFGLEGSFNRVVVSLFLGWMTVFSDFVCAEQYNIVISGTHTGNIILTAGPPGSPSLVTAASGTLDGQVVTGLTATGICGANNLINVSGQLGWVDGGGINVKYGSGSDYTNLFSSPSGPISAYQINCGAVDGVTSTTTIASAPAPSPVPSLSEWSQMLLGLLVMTLLGWHFQ